MAQTIRAVACTLFVDYFLYLLHGGRLGPRDVIGHVTIQLAIGHFLLVVLWSQAYISLTASGSFNGECNAIVDMTLNDL